MVLTLMSMRDIHFFQITSESGAYSGEDVNQGTLRDNVNNLDAGGTRLIDMQNVDRIDFFSSTTALIIPKVGTTIHIYGKQNGGTTLAIPSNGTNLISTSGVIELGLHYITLTADEDVALGSNMEGIFINAVRSGLVVLDNVRVQNVAFDPSSTDIVISGVINIMGDTVTSDVEITNSIFENITVDGGGDIRGAAIHAEDSNLTITNSTFSDIRLDGGRDIRGAAIHAEDSNLTITNGIFSNIRLMGGTSTSGSVLYYGNTSGNVNDLTVTNSLFSRNMAEDISGDAVGGAIAVAGRNGVSAGATTRNTIVSIVGSRFINNSVSTTSTGNFSRGGALWLQNGTTTIGGAGTARNIFTGNSAANTADSSSGAEGGAIALVVNTTGTSIEINNNSFGDNSIIRAGDSNTADASVVNTASVTPTITLPNVGWLAPTTP